MVILLAVSTLGIEIGSVVLGLSAIVGLILGFGFAGYFNELGCRGMACYTKTVRQR